MSDPADVASAGLVPTPPANRWDLLPCPEIGGWSPSLPVSIVVPARCDQETLDRTLASLAEQTYPSSLLEVIVVDDGSVPPLEVSSWCPDLGVRLVRGDRTASFGAGSARNRGAAEAHGDVLLFMDSDMVAEAEAVEAHARWHHLVLDAATMGAIKFVDFGDLSPDDVRAATREGKLAALFRDQPISTQQWRERHIQESVQLTVERPDLFRVVVSANLGVRRALFDEVDGFRVEGIRGVEDIELGYRLFTAGALLVPDEQACFWHQGRRFFDTADAKGAKRRRDPAIRNLIPVSGFRPQSRGRVYDVPSVHVDIEAHEATYEDVRETVASILAGTVADVHIRIAVSMLSERELLIREFSGDPRVEVTGSDREPGLVASPARVRVRKPVAFSSRSLEWLVAAVLEQPWQPIHLSLGETLGASVVEVVSTRADNRIRRQRIGFSVLQHDVWQPRVQAAAVYGVVAPESRKTPGVVVKTLRRLAGSVVNVERWFETRESAPARWAAAQLRRLRHSPAAQRLSRRVETS